ncbi:hypothetical protein C8R44DRAFT_855642 [Mycena epipterygia]|nr:hypothetical protein C8R44DRAFT_855642 [Mycena epipterygia]
MPPSSRVDKILEYTVVAANALRDVSTAAQIPFLDNVCTLSLTVIPIVQNTTFQKERCLRMVEEIHQLLCALMGLCIHSEDICTPKMLDQIAEFAFTLQKLHSCLKAQRELGTIKRLFKQSEITVQLDSCEKELRAASEIFTVGRSSMNTR